MGSTFSESMRSVMAVVRIAPTSSCMNLCSGCATIGLVAEVTGLVGKQVHEVGSEHETEMSGLRILNDIIRTS